jgi:CHASE3 domain sensor protein
MKKKIDKFPDLKKAFAEIAKKASLDTQKQIKSFGIEMKKYIDKIKKESQEEAQKYIQERNMVMLEAVNEQLKRSREEYSAGLQSEVMDVTKALGDVQIDTAKKVKILEFKVSALEKKDKHVSVA